MCPKKYWPWRFIVKFLTLSFLVPVSTFAQPRASFRHDRLESARHSILRACERAGEGRQ